MYKYKVIISKTELIKGKPFLFMCDQLIKDDKELEFIKNLYPSSHIQIIKRVQP